MGRGVRAVLGDFGELGVGRGGAYGVCKVCEEQREGGVMLGIKSKHPLAAVLAALNLTPTRDLQVVLSLVLMLVWALEGCRRWCSGVRAN